MPANRDASGGTAQSENALDTIICGTYPAGDGTQRPEYYIVRSMTRKLSYYPQFATAIGMQSVKTCEEARAFKLAYAKYFAAHPYFDKDLPSDPSAAQAPVLPANAAPRATIRKVFNGTPTGPGLFDPPFPVVRINHVFKKGAVFFNGQLINPPDGAVFHHSCSGVFISKNFILTAAHCFELLALQFDPNRPGDVNRTQWITAGDWFIDWPDDTGQIGGETLETTAVTIVHPSFSDAVNPPFYPTEAGQENPGILPFYDIGLLFIPPVQNDGALPGNADQSSWDVQYEDADSIIANWALTTYGFGSTDSFGTNKDILNSKSGAGADLADFGQPTNGGNTVLKSRVTFTPWPNWAGCFGDSGGPMVRQVRNTMTNAVLSTVVVAIDSSIGLATSIAGTQCASHQNDVTYWARTDVAKRFLIDTIKHWQLGPDFDEKAHAPDEPNHPHSYVRLHGKSCGTDCNCGPTEFCYNPVNSPNSPYARGATKCSHCDDCSCVTGQCLPVPGGADAGTDAGRQCP